MKMEEIKKLIQKAGPMRLGVVVLCGVLLILFSSGVSFSGSGGNKETKEATAQEPDITAADTVQGEDEAGTHRDPSACGGGGECGSHADAEGV